FAFALWDGRNKRLFCARDHLGLKPFYYVRSGTAFAFASEIKGLFALPWVSRRLNETRIADYLMHMMEDKESTFYEGILRLPPAHTLTVTPDGVQLRRYWALDPNREVRYSSDDDYAEAYRELFTDAVRCRLRNASPVGSFLSGGLDSSSVTCVARALLSENSGNSLDTFSLIFDELPQCDERPYIEAVLEQGGMTPHYVHGDQVHPLDNMDKMLWHVDEPFFTPNLFLYWNLYGAAQAQGVRVVLDGFLGDNVVSHGSRYITELAATGHWLKLAREMYTTASVLGGRKKHLKQLFQEFVLAPLVMEPLQRSWGALTRQELPAYADSRFINREFAHRIGWMERARAYKVEAPRTPHSARQEHFEELTSGMLPGALETANKAAAAFGMTPHFPFTDRRLMEFCLAIPVTQKYHKGWTRMIARRGLSDYLPEKIRNRYGKTYLGQAFHRSLFVLGREEMDSLVFDRLSIAAPYVDVDALQQAYRQIIQNQEQGQHQGNQDSSLAIWYAVILTRWLELEKDRNSATRDCGIVETVTAGFQSVSIIEP
ncbi:MAG: asparagine synthetase B, partial [Chloroflexi bacterium]|nr:asparagine synthetase B [Chloroflexota bacterium]